MLVKIVVRGMLAGLLLVGLLSGPAFAGRQSEFGTTDVIFGVADSDPGIINVPDGGVAVGTPATVTNTLNNLGIVPTLVEVEVGPIQLSAGTADAYGRCELRSDYPHHSSTQPGYIHAKGASKCTVWMPSLYESGILWKHRWYGWQDTGYKNASGSGYTNQVVNTHYCKGTTYSYIVENYHYGRWPSGGEYKRLTANDNRVTCP